MAEPRYPFVAIDVPSALSEEVAQTLFELGASGVEERDDQTLARGASVGVVTLVGSFETREQADGAVTELELAYPDLTGFRDGAKGPRIEEVVGDAWRDAWKEHFTPFALTPRITVAPPWVPRNSSRAPMAEHWLELEPGRAFGTGLHASTGLIAELLDTHAHELEDCDLLDVGTGSGILSLVALLYGAKHAEAIDIDADVIELVRENAERNDMTSRLEAYAGTVDKVTRTFPWVLANIEARVLRPIAKDLVRVLEPGGMLVLSGILESEHDAMVELYTSLRLTHTETRRRRDDSGEGWVAIAFSAHPSMHAL